MKHLQIFCPKQLVMPLVLFAVLSFGVPAYGQKAWEKKPYEQWNLQEVAGILSDSPWAQTRIEGVRTKPEQTVIRLRSALPVRQALVRERQIFLNYHKFTDADKARFQSDVKEVLECSECAESYMVTVSSGKLAALRRMSAEQVKPFVYLANDKGERRQLIRFIPPKSDSFQAMFVFQRLDDAGKPLVTPGNKTFYFKIEDKLLESESAQTVPIARFTFEVSRLTQNGQVIF